MKIILAKSYILSHRIKVDRLQMKNSIADGKKTNKAANRFLHYTFAKLSVYSMRHARGFWRWHKSVCFACRFICSIMKARNKWNHIFTSFQQKFLASDYDCQAEKWSSKKFWMIKTTQRCCCANAGNVFLCSKTKQLKQVQLKCLRSLATRWNESLFKSTTIRNSHEI